MVMEIWGRGGHGSVLGRGKRRRIKKGILGILGAHQATIRMI